MQVFRRGLERVAHYGTRRVHPFPKVISVPKLLTFWFYQPASLIFTPQCRLGVIPVFRELDLILITATISAVSPCSPNRQRSHFLAKLFQEYDSSPLSLTTSSPTPAPLQ